MKTATVCFLLTLTQLAAAAGPTSRPAVRLGDPIDMPTLGLRLRLPEDEKLVVPAIRTVALMGRSGEDPEWSGGTTLTPIVGRHDQKAIPARDIAEQVMLAVLKKREGQRSEALTSAPADVGTFKGWRLARTFSVEDKSVLVSVTAWSVDFADRKVRLYYLLTTLWPGKDAAVGMVRAKAVADSVRVIPMRSPEDAALPPLIGPVTLREEGLSVSVPRGWAPMQIGRRDGEVALVALDVDYARGRNVQNMNVTVRGRTPNEPLAGKDRKVIDRYAEELVHAMKAGRKWTHISHRVVRFAGRTGVEVVGEVTHQGIRCVSVQRQAFHDGRVYTLSLLSADPNPKRAVAAMDAIAGTFRFLEPKDKATSRPPARGEADQP